MSFKDQIREDFDRVLLDPEVFGRICSWNDSPLKIAEDSAAMFQDFHTPGVNSERKIIYCRDIDLTPIPRVTEPVDLDGVIWYVFDVKMSFGFMIITLERRTS